MPFEIEPRLTYFSIAASSCGLPSPRATGEQSSRRRDGAGDAMLRDFESSRGDFIRFSRSRKRPADRDDSRWSCTATCYQLKSAMAWWDLFEATREPRFTEPYERVLEASLRTWANFLPGHADRHKVMDRLHAFGYFLEGLLARADEPRCVAALRDGIARCARHLRDIAPEFERSDVYAQLLRVRLHAGWLGIVPLDLPAAQCEAERLAAFQVTSADPRIDGGYWFGRRGGAWLPFVNPVSAAFAGQALELWEAGRRGEAQPHRHLLI